MSLHPIVPDSILPEVLKRKLVFGDREQIYALNQLQSIIAEAESNGVDTSKPLKKFKVTVQIIQEEDYTVCAEDSRQAEEVAEKMAEEEFDATGKLIEIDGVREVK